MTNRALDLWAIVIFMTALLIWFVLLKALWGLVT
jgi:hypothetical protein